MAARALIIGVDMTVEARYSWAAGALRANADSMRPWEVTSACDTDPGSESKPGTGSTATGMPASVAGARRSTGRR